MLRITTILLCLFFIVPAEARQHHRASGLAEGCNVLWPCEVPYASSPQRARETRGKYVARQMGFGAPRAVPTPRRRPASAFGAPSHPAVSIGSGIVRSVSGATARVAASATSAFQCLVTALDHVGYKIAFMGGFSSGHMRHSLHHTGMALDVNQYSRDVTRPPMPSNEIEIANSCGLVSGRQWRGNPDSGHFQKNG